MQSPWKFFFLRTLCFGFPSRSLQELLLFTKNPKF